MAALFVAGAAGLWLGATTWAAWRGIERFPFDVERTRSALGARPGPQHGGGDTLLLVGVDAGRAGAPRADAVLLLAHRPGGDAVLVSLPRDLMVDEPCRGEAVRLAATMAGCEGVASGPELLALAVEDFTGWAVDHVAVFDFAGFERVVEEVGGVELCVERSVKISKNGPVLLPAGCSVAGGPTALAWMRNRLTLEEVGGRWRPLPGIGDRQRNERQREVVAALLRKVRERTSPWEQRGLLRTASGAVALDDTLGWREAWRLARRLAAIDLATLREVELPGRLEMSDQGQVVFHPEGTFADAVAS